MDGRRESSMWLGLVLLVQLSRSSRVCLANDQGDDQEQQG